MLAATAGESIQAVCLPTEESTLLAFPPARSIDFPPAGSLRCPPAASCRSSRGTFRGRTRFPDRLQIPLSVRFACRHERNFRRQHHLSRVIPKGSGSVPCRLISMSATSPRHPETSGPSHRCMPPDSSCRAPARIPIGSSTAVFCPNFFLRNSAVSAEVFALDVDGYHAPSVRSEIGDHGRNALAPAGSAKRSYMNVIMDA